MKHQEGASTGARLHTCLYVCERENDESEDLMVHYRFTLIQVEWGKNSLGQIHCKFGHVVKTFLMKGF